MDLVQEASDMDIDALTGTGRCGLMVFMHGHFIGADLFGDPSWYAGSERHLLRSAFAVCRYGSGLQPRECGNVTGTHAILAESVLRDASHGAWLEGRSIGIERTATLVHPYLEASCSCTVDGQLLHMQASTVAGFSPIRN